MVNNTCSILNLENKLFYPTSSEALMHVCTRYADS